MPAPAARVLLTRRGVLLTAVCLLVVAACGVLGTWQWQRGNVVLSSPAAAHPVVDVQGVVGRTDPLTVEEVGRRVRLVGTWDEDVQLLLPRRRLEGAEGSWVLGVVRLADGSGVPVVRGWVPAGTTAAPPAAGAADLVGVVQPPEASDDAPGSGPLPDGQVWVASPALLVNRVGYPLLPAYAVATTAGAPLRVAPPEEAGSAERRLDWRNLAYAAQWAVFGGFAVLVWVRALRDEVGAPTGPVAGAGPPDPAPGPAPDPAPGPACDHDPHHVHDGGDQLLEEHTR
ncbi:SURF1 family protein [Kineococcus glutinatus]|uniref:SURF1-like protein n=1 Tax=Kineococcus glutinatus TaxID=1070872 RepID=A0ABP9I7S1_9ACTN